MPKMRGFKPEVWTDDKFVDLEPLARLLFMGMWNYACDNGHIDDKPKQIKMRVLPTDDCDPVALIDHMIQLGMVQRDNDGLTVPKLRTHQRLDNRFFSFCDRCALADIPMPSRSKHPEYAKESRGAHDEDTSSAHVHPSEVEGRKEGEGEMKEGDVGDADAPPSTSLALVAEHRPDVERICETLADHIEARGNKRPSVTARWRNETRLMLDRDGRTEPEVIACLRWLFTSSHRDAKFWATNIRSMPKLREEFDRLRELASRPATGGGSRASEQTALLERAMARAQAKMAAGGDS